MLNLAQVTSRKVVKPPIISLYGRPGTGKTTLGADFPDPIFIQTEEGAGDLEIASFTPGDSFKDYVSVLNALSQVYNDPHSFKTLVFDSVNHLEPLIQSYVCGLNGWVNIEAPGYGKGYIAVQDEFQNFWAWIELIRLQRNMNVILLGHPSAETAPDPHLDAHKRFQLKMDKRAASFVVEKSDGVFLIDRVTTVRTEDAKMGAAQPGKATTSGQRVIYTDGGASFEAKTRFKIPAELMIPLVGGYSVIAPYLLAQDHLGTLKPEHPLAVAHAQAVLAQQQAAAGQEQHAAPAEPVATPTAAPVEPVTDEAAAIAEAQIAAAAQA